MANLANFKEESIRPSRYNQEKRLAVAEDLNFLLERKHRFCFVDCPACGARGDYLFTKKQITYEQCSVCRTVFVNPRPSLDLLHEFYAQSKVYAFWNKYIFPASDQSRRTNIFVPRVDRMLEICAKTKTAFGTLLEVGSGFGTFAEEVRSRNEFEQIILLEMTPGLAQSCRERGFEVYETPVEKLKLTDASVDVIASFETLEHLYSPQQFICACKRLLKPGGILVLSVPNFYGFDILALSTYSNSIDHEHLNYFNPTSLPLLLTKCGLQVVDVQTPGCLDVDIVRNKILADDVGSSFDRFLQHVLIDRDPEVREAFQRFLVENMLSSHLWVTARC
jgi:SAM-dependent methyltransferase